MASPTVATAAGLQVVTQSRLRAFRKCRQCAMEDKADG